ncbi:MAG: inactive transglutaminase family protein [Legionellaceae bacterium]|nr:inactive transglutaminase family protein [Legionellaceae bacterium]
MQSHTRHVYGLICALLLIGLWLFFYRHIVLEVPLTDNETVKTWTVEVNMRFNSFKDTPIKASFMVPYRPPGFAILDEYFLSHNYGVSTNLQGDNRQTIWSLRRAHGSQSLYYRAIFKETDAPEELSNKIPRIKPLPLPEQQQAAVHAIISHVRQTSADIQTFAQQTIRELQKTESKLLLESVSTENNMLFAANLILRQANIYAIPVWGLYLKPTHHTSFQPLLAVYTGKSWIYINPNSNVVGLPKHFLIWAYGDTPLFEVMGGKNLRYTFTISETPMNALTMAKLRGVQTDSQLLRFSLLQLPVSAQDVYKVLLTVPVGAFIILILRNFIGIKTFGTFMPVLIALAFRETNVIAGIFLFVTIVSFGLLARFYLNHLRLLVVPRLSAILTIVILLMMMMSVLSQNLGLDSGLSIALFPMVILTMTIERMCILWDERGPSEAIRAGLGSLLAAVIAYFVMSYPPLQYLLFAFPELLLVLLALIFALGQYKGYRLLELKRFKSLGT